MGTTVTGTKITGTKGEIEQSKDNFNSAKERLLDNITTINNLCNPILSNIFDNYGDDENPSSIKKNLKILKLI